MPIGQGSGGPKRGKANSEPLSTEERRAHLKAIVEQIDEIRAQGRFEEILERCKQIGVSPKTIKRWLRTPDSAPSATNLELVASALREFGFPTEYSFRRELDIDERRAKRDKTANEIVDAVDRVILDTSIVEDAGKEVTILTADLVGSIASRHDRAELDWLKEIRIHNLVTEAYVTRLTGRVIKFSGGLILAEFDGKRHEERAIRAGLGIIEALEVRNKKTQNKKARMLETAIGVASGEVFWLKYEQSNEPDLQGPTVHLAFRLCGLAGRQQLVCAEDTFQAAGGEDAFPNSSKKLDRFVKGFDVPVAMRVVLPEGHACEDLRLIGHRRETRPENLDLLNAARKALEKGDFVDEEKSFRELVRKEPGNFEANFRLAERLLIRQPKKGETPSGNITKASEHLRTARQINPDAWRVWFLASAARRSKFANSRDYADLDRAITHAEEALKKATEFVDADGMDQTKLVLAGLLLDRSKDPERDGADDLARAAEYCNDIEKAFDGVQTRRKSDRLVFTAMVQLAQGGEPRNTIRKMLDEAIGIDTNNANAHRALAEFLEGGDGSDSGTSPVSG